MPTHTELRCDKGGGQLWRTEQLPLRAQGAKAVTRGAATCSDLHQPSADNASFCGCVKGHETSSRGEHWQHSTSSLSADQNPIPSDGSSSCQTCCFPNLAALSVAQAFQLVDSELLQLLAGQAPVPVAPGPGAQVPDVMGSASDQGQHVKTIDPTAEASQQGSVNQQQATGSPQEAGSTAVLAIVWPGTAQASGSVAAADNTPPSPTPAAYLLVANVGNSRAALCRRTQSSTSLHHTDSSQGTLPAGVGEHDWASGTPASIQARAARRRQLRQQHHHHKLHASESQTQHLGEHESAEPVPGSAHSGHPHLPEDLTGSTAAVLEAVVLTEDHEVSNPAEAARILAAGGNITTTPGGHRPRLGGDLELSRAFGDLSYRSQGLTAQPAVLGPMSLSEGDLFLVLASDGIFETMTASEVCSHAGAIVLDGQPIAPSPPRPAAIALGGVTSQAQGASSSADADEPAQMVSATPIQSQLSGSASESSSKVSSYGLDACCDCGAPAPAAALGDALCQDAEDQAASLAEEACSREVSSRSISDDPDGGDQVVDEEQQRSKSCGDARAAWAAQRLIQEAYNRGSMDNLAAVVVDLRRVDRVTAVGADICHGEAPATAAVTTADDTGALNIPADIIKNQQESRAAAINAAGHTTESKGSGVDIGKLAKGGRRLSPGAAAAQDMQQAAPGISEQQPNEHRQNSMQAACKGCDVLAGAPDVDTALALARQQSGFTAAATAQQLAVQQQAPQVEQQEQHGLQRQQEEQCEAQQQTMVDDSKQHAQAQEQQGTCKGTEGGTLPVCYMSPGSSLGSAIGEGGPLTSAHETINVDYVPGILTSSTEGLFPQLRHWLWLRLCDRPRTTASNCSTADGTEGIVGMAEAYPAQEQQGFEYDSVEPLPFTLTALQQQVSRPGLPACTETFSPATGPFTRLHTWVCKQLAGSSALVPMQASTTVVGPGTVVTCAAAAGLPAGESDSINVGQGAIDIAASYELQGMVQLVPSQFVPALTHSHWALTAPPRSSNALQLDHLPLPMLPDGETCTAPDSCSRSNSYDSQTATLWVDRFSLGSAPSTPYSSTARQHTIASGYAAEALPASMAPEQDAMLVKANGEEIHVSGQATTQQFDGHREQQHLPDSLEPTWLLLADLEREAWLPQQLGQEMDATDQPAGTGPTEYSDEHMGHQEVQPAESNDLSGSARSLLTATVPSDYTAHATHQLNTPGDHDGGALVPEVRSALSDKQERLAPVQLNSPGSGSNSVGAALTAAAVSLLLGESSGGRRGRSLLMAGDDDDDEEPDSEQSSHEGFEELAMRGGNQDQQPGSISILDQQQLLETPHKAATLQDALVVPLPAKARPTGTAAGQQGRAEGLQLYKGVPDYSAGQGNQQPDSSVTAPGKIRAGLPLSGAPRYRVGSQVGQGHFGEVWRAIRRPLKEARVSPGSRQGPSRSNVQPTRVGAQSDIKADSASTVDATIRRSSGGQASRFASSLSKSIDKVLHPHGHKSLHWQWPWQPSKPLQEAQPPTFKASPPSQHDIYLGAESQNSYQGPDYDSKTDPAAEQAEVVVLKRIFAERGEAVRLSGLRELHFGRLLRPYQLMAASPGAPATGLGGAGFLHLGRFIEAFETPSQRCEPPQTTAPEEEEPPVVVLQPKQPGAKPGPEQVLQQQQVDQQTDGPRPTDGNDDQPPMVVNQRAKIQSKQQQESIFTAGQGSDHIRGRPPPQPSSQDEQQPTKKGGSSSKDLWLVFADEGQSLHDLMYEPLAPAADAEPDQEESSQARQDDEASTTQRASVLNHAAARPELYLQDAAEAGLVFGAGGHPSKSRAASGAAAPTQSSVVPSSTEASSNAGSFAPKDEPGTEDTEEGSGGASFRVLGPSRWWHSMRRSPQGPDMIRNVMLQVLSGLEALQALNVTHRDIKPENLMVRLQQQGSHRAAPGSASGYKGGSSKGSTQHGGESKLSAAGAFNASQLDSFHITIIDMGSAVDAHTLKQQLYGPAGPSGGELTLEYAPPEALFGRMWEGSTAMRPLMAAYDAWSAGVVWLELLLGTPHVWALGPATQALLDARLAAAGRPEAEWAAAHLLRGLLEWCITPWPGGAGSGGAPPPAGSSTDKGGGGSAHGAADAQGHDSKHAADTASTTDPTTTSTPGAPTVSQPAVKQEGEGGGGQRGGIRKLAAWRRAGPYSPPDSLPADEESSDQLISQGNSAEEGHEQVSALPTASAAAGQATASSFESSPVPGSAQQSPPPPPWSQQLVAWSCTDAALLDLIRERDPTGVGLRGSLLGVRLLRRLLSWSPAQRPTAREALLHAYFTSTPGSNITGANSNASEAGKDSHHNETTGSSSNGGGDRASGAPAAAAQPQVRRDERLQRSSTRRSRHSDRSSSASQRYHVMQSQQENTLRWEQDVLQACGSIPMGQVGWC